MSDETAVEEVAEATETAEKTVETKENAETKTEEKVVETDASETKTEEAEWRASIADEDLRKQADRYASIEDMLKHNVNLRKKVSSALVLPGEDASDDELKDFRTKLGVPESPQDYVYDPPEDLHETVKVSKEELDEVFEKAHELGLSQAQIKGLMDFRLEQVDRGTKAFVQRVEQATQKADGDLRREWGDDYKANLNLADRAIREFGGEEMREWMKKTVVDGSRLDNHPSIVKWAAQVGRRMQEASIHMDRDSGEAQSMEDKRAELTNKIHEALAAGNSQQAARLDRERRELTTSLYGNDSIVGQNNRVA